MLKRLYDWVLHWAETPYGTWALFFLAFAESSFFPIPPDVLLIALAISIPKKSFKYALVCSIGSVLGGAFGYLIGLEFMELIGQPIIDFYGVNDKYNYIKELYNKYDAWAIAVAGFTPIPYKVFTIAAGACKIKFSTFFLASIISRSARFFIIGGLIHAFGPSIKSFIDRYFNILAIVFMALLILGFLAIKWVF
ncbi:MAG: YqaA family protein [Pseudomonadota bacterium]